jgi:hypothetical protein
MRNGTGFLFSFAKLLAYFSEVSYILQHDENWRRKFEMTTKEIKKTVDNMKKLTKKVCTTKTEARKFLVSVGIYTKQGQLAKAYR